MVIPWGCKQYLFGHTYPSLITSKDMPEKMPGMCLDDSTFIASRGYPYWCLTARLLVRLEKLE